MGRGVGGLGLACAGCATMSRARPWEKGDLARASMQDGSDRLEAKYSEHIYQSKEMAGGGQGGQVAGGRAGARKLRKEKLP